VRRREFIALLTIAAAGWPRVLAAQQGTKIPRIGVLSPTRSEGPDVSRVALNGLVAGLGDLGYVEGQNIFVEREFAGPDANRLRERASALVKSQVDLIVALSTTAARPAKQATSVIPIVAFGMADPVDDELVVSLARPGGNVTGTTFLGPELVTKRLELLSEVVPQHSRVAILWHPHAYADRTMDGMLKEAKHAAQMLGMQLQFVPASSPEDLTGAFSMMTRDRADALCVFPSPMLYAEYGRIVRTAAEKMLPAIYAAREGVELGGLMSYGANLANPCQAAAANRAGWLADGITRPSPAAPKRALPSKRAPRSKQTAPFESGVDVHVKMPSELIRFFPREH
jgi:putative tryptophan/tyrosine transport system substrate-binding protein